MKDKLLQIAHGFSIPANDYANQANAILGIREAGKTYTAMKAAEELLDNHIPIIVFDPVGIWKNLKISMGDNKGYPIVVAGGEGADIRLTKDNAEDIVRAAMKENVSLVIDLYSPELINKSTWIAIVQSTVDLLMYQNKAYGLRHIFIEEAAEFIPQKLQPQHARVYASIERLARMGRNAHLGMTIINQRAEEVNKAILEICELSLIHKQVGKNSMLSIQKWLEVRQLENVKDIIKSLPLLKKGECWAVGLSDQPQRIQVSKKKTFHPDPKQTDKNQERAITVTVMDVTSFVTKLNKQLQKEVKPAIAKPNKSAVSSLSAKDANQNEKLQATITELKKLNQQQANEILYWKKLAAAMGVVLNKINNLSVVEAPPMPENSSNSQNFSNSDKKIPLSGNLIPKSGNSIPIVSSPPVDKSLGKCSLAILRFLATYPDRSFTKTQVGVAIGYSPISSSFNNSLSELNTLGLISRGEGRLIVNRVVNLKDFTGEYQKQEYNAYTFRDKLQKCEREIYDVLLNRPKEEFTKEDLAEATESNYSPTSSSYNNSLSKLNTLELINRSHGIIKLNPELIELL